MHLLATWGKGSFICDVQGAADGGQAEYRTNVRLGMERLRLDAKLAATRQQGEARLRHAHRQGPEAIKALTPAQLFDFQGGEERCCICLSEPPTVANLLCGHCALCSACADLVEAGPRRCPLCRARFTRSFTDVPQPDRADSRQIMQL